MKLGIVARADDRGLGTLTGDFAANLEPDRVLVVREPGAESDGFAAHVDRYPGATVVLYDAAAATLPEQECRAFFEGLDVAYMAETPYDYRLFEWAADAGCATVLHVMPEFWRWADPLLPRPTVWWLPTTWRADMLPAECRLVPVPVPTAPHDAPSAPTAGMVHVAGHRAAADRNGTLLLFQALRRVRGPVSMRFECQDTRFPSVSGLRSGVNASTHLGGRVDRWSLYDDVGVLVMPRRYGGLCLPALEAFARGLAVVMTNVEPQRSSWPIIGLPADHRRRLDCQAGPLIISDCRVSELARTIDELAADGRVVAREQARVRSWAAANNWTALRPVIVEELERACR